MRIRLFILPIATIFLQNTLAFISFNTFEFVTNPAYMAIEWRISEINVEFLTKPLDFGSFSVVLKFTILEYLV